MSTVASVSLSSSNEYYYTLILIRLSGIPVALVVSLVMVIPFIPIRLATLDRVEAAAPVELLRPLEDASVIMDVKISGYYDRGKIVVNVGC